jgi:hypothetical protein
MAQEHFVATGITITFAGFTAEVLNVTPPSPRREAINVSHQGTTTAHRFDPAKLVDWGELSLDVHFDPSVKPPMTGSKGQCIITFADSAATTWTFQAFAVSFNASAPLENKATGTFVLKVDGPVA